MAPKYKLFSAGGPGEKVCAFFNSPAGCKIGDSCKFLHVKESSESPPSSEMPKSVPSVVNDASSSSSSVVSSESSDDNESLSAPAIPIATPEKTKKQKKEKLPKEVPPEKEKTKVCSYFNSKAGCKNGADCKFIHETEKSSDSQTPKKAKANKNQPQQQDFQNNLRLLQQQQEQLAKLQQQLLKQQEQVSQKKSKKRKKKDEETNSSVFATQPKAVSSTKKSKVVPEQQDENPFALESEPVSEKKQSQKKVRISKTPAAGSYAALAYSSDSDQENDDNESDEDEGLKYLAELKSKLPKAAVTPKTKPQSSSNSNQTFRSLGLPISPFTFRANSSSVKDTIAPSSPSRQSSDSSPSTQFPLPKRTAEGFRYLPTIEASRAHSRYKSSYDFDKYKEQYGEKDWIRTQPFSKKYAANPQVIAIDCEMVETKDPVTGSIDGKALCRISVVNALNPSEVLLDTLVKPNWPVTNYRTFVNGITENDLESVKFTLRHAQAFMMALCSEETVIIGHALYNDLVALRLEHYCNVDTAYLFKVKGDDSENQNSVPSLKDCATTILGKEMPNTHDSINDAITSLDCCNHYLDHGGDVEEVVRTKRSSDSYDTLLVHRIPLKGCTKNDIANLFLQTCFVKPKEVDDIEFGSSTGKTYVRFFTNRHASLAFESLKGSASTDKTGKEQKKVYMRNGDYIQVRKMMKAKKEN